MSPIKFTTLFLLLHTIFNVQAQNVIKGKVLDHHNNVIAGANVFLDNTYDGVSSNQDGVFEFDTDEKGDQVLVVSYLGYEDHLEFFTIKKENDFHVILKQGNNELEEVLLVSNNDKSRFDVQTMELDPMDVATMAGSDGNIIAALGNLPGAQVAGDSGRLIIRGGDASETSIFIDGLKVYKPYEATVGNVPTRGRFSPFTFDGFSFNSGGYGVSNGQALSGILDLKTKDWPTEEKVDISFMNLLLGTGFSSMGDNSAVSANTSFIDLSFANLILDNRVDWESPYRKLSGETMFQYHGQNDDILKVYFSGSHANFKLNRFNIVKGREELVSLRNNNFYLNSSYKRVLDNGWKFFLGASGGIDNNYILADTDQIESSQNGFFLKTEINKSFGGNGRLKFGSDFEVNDTTENYNKNGFTISSAPKIGSLFADYSYDFSPNFLINTGVRLENNFISAEKNILPRFSLTYKQNEFSKLSFSAGNYSQMASFEFAKFSEELKSQKSTMFNLNYSHEKENRFLNVDIYRKNYNKLLTFDSNSYEFINEYSLEGEGYAQGIDVFWRDKKSVKNLEYWISYSYIDTKRKYLNYPEKVTPSFITDHNFSFVGKYWFSKWRTMFGLTYNYASGRPYTNPNQVGFLNQKTKSFNAVDLSTSVLLTNQKILYFSVSNVLGNKNVFGYEYGNNLDVSGQFPSQAIRPTSDRFFLVGFFWTISKDKSLNQLENL